MDSNLYGAFPVKWCFSVYCRFFVRSGKLPFFIPSPTIRFPERAQWGQGTETLAKLGALPPSGDACKRLAESLLLLGDLVQCRHFNLQDRV